MTTGQILLAIITGLAVNECCDVSPWAARKLVRWSARRRYAPPSRAELRAEELAAYIDVRPGRLFKLITALGFAVAAIVTRKVPLGVAPAIPLWWPTTLTVPVHYGDYGYDNGFGNANALAVGQAWYQLTSEVRNAAKEVGVGSRSWGRCVKELQKLTGDDRWTLIERNLGLLEKVNHSRVKSTTKHFYFVAGAPYVAFQWSCLTNSTVTHYQAAVETARAEIRCLTSDFLLSSAPR